MAGLPTITTVPEGPGFGIEYDWDWIESTPTGKKVIE
jgi:hypothetical protein